MTTRYWRIQQFEGLTDGKPSWRKVNSMRYRSAEAADAELQRLTDKNPDYAFRVVKRKRADHKRLAAETAFRRPMA